jgi:Endonuclease/Exonuclease/phosphatase family
VLGGVAGNKPVKDLPTSTVAFFNVENLFDTVDDPKINDEDFLPNSRLEWTVERYQTKLRNLATVIAELGSADGPDVLGLNETENKRVLQDLVKEPLLADRHYQIVHFDSPDPRGIDCALLFKPNRFKVVRQRSVKLALPDTTMGTRDLLVVDGLLNQEPITFMVAHWPSRRGGQKAVKRRLAVAKQCRQVIDEYLKTDPKARIVLMGNLNDTPLDESVSAILGASGEASDLAAGRLYNAYYELQQMGKGTMYFRSRPDVFDQMVLSRGLLTDNGLHFLRGSAAIYAPERLTNPQTKFPGESLGTFVGRKYIGGYSDHFAVYLTLTTESSRSAANQTGQ